jgi:aspartate/methionine/tyrosine aminotransferase
MRQFPASPITELIDSSPQYNLGESYAPHLSVADILDPAEVAGLSLGYGTSAGDEEPRALIAARLGVPDEQVLLTAGASAALFLVGLLHSDGEILVDVLRIDAQTPCAASAPGSSRCPRIEDGYRVDLDAFRDALSARTRLVWSRRRRILPASLLPRGEVSEMLSAMSRRCPEAVLLIDETTTGKRPTAALRRPILHGLSGWVLTCASLSKAYGSPGLRIGWLTVADPRLREQLRLAKSLPRSAALSTVSRCPAAVAG